MLDEVERVAKLQLCLLDGREMVVVRRSCNHWRCVLVLVGGNVLVTIISFLRVI